MPKKSFTQKLKGPRRRGRPSKGWVGEVERDLQVLGVRRWRELLMDRENGRISFDRTKTTVGCSEKKKKKKKKKKKEKEKKEKKKEKK